jgi:uncharacterized membrane protein YebE (DUF533 family)
MSTRTTISLICVLGISAPLLVRLGAKTGLTIFTILAVIGSLAALGLMAYAAFREQTTGDKSERVSPKGAAIIFCGIGLLVAFTLYRALVH